MYRIIYFILLLNIINSQQWCEKERKYEKKKPTWKQKHVILKKEDIAKLLTEVDTVLQRYCNQNSKIRSVIYSEDEYVIKYHLPGINQKDVKVRSMYRLLYTHVEKPDSEQTLEDIVSLPDFLNFTDAYWNLEDNFLTITVPYKMKFGETTEKICESVSEIMDNVVEYYSFAIYSWMLR